MYIHVAQECIFIYYYALLVAINSLYFPLSMHVWHSSSKSQSSPIWYNYSCYSVFVLL